MHRQASPSSSAGVRTNTFSSYSEVLCFNKWDIQRLNLHQMICWRHLCFVFVFLHIKTSPHLLQSKHCFAVNLQNCFVDLDTSPDCHIGMMSG